MCRDESWYDSANARLAEIFSKLEPGLSERDLKRITRDAYPWGERRYLPYKMWLKAAKRWRTAYLAGRAAPALRPQRKRDHNSPDQLRLEETR